ncbi:hypothetical protein [Nitrosomonas sp. sh817]|uniref:hypothetical protein n=1 Tax=Nitrosomonas sp. sh817 TaxID=3070658 RepID=UPI0027DD2783|nr:hypothetical protein [Nitrosomonas sp. sh817]WMJ07330.1 hypothetical protein RBH92_07705 [Nitrosomonas sp. sh817]
MNFTAFLNWLADEGDGFAVSGVIVTLLETIFTESAPGTLTQRKATNLMPPDALRPVLKKKRG